MAAPLIVETAQVVGSKAVKKVKKIGRAAVRKNMSLRSKMLADNLDKRDISSQFNHVQYGARTLSTKKLAKKSHDDVNDWLLQPNQQNSFTQVARGSEKQNIMIRLARGVARRLFVGRIVIPITFLGWQLGLSFWVMSLFGAALAAFGTTLTEYIPFLDLFIDPATFGYIFFAVGWLISSLIAIFSMCSSYLVMNKIKLLTFMSTYTFIILLALSIAPLSGGMLPWATIWAGATYITR